MMASYTIEGGPAHTAYMAYAIAPTGRITIDAASMYRVLVEPSGTGVVFWLAHDVLRPCGDLAC